jgi:hypothetical protein
VSVLFIASVVWANGARAQFCPGAGYVFDDVAAGDAFCGYITWMAQNGVSQGCQVIDASHRLYCPAASVTRSQMAAFVSRAFDMPHSTAIGVGTMTKQGTRFLQDGGHDSVFLG